MLEEHPHNQERKYPRLTLYSQCFRLNLSEHRSRGSLLTEGVQW